jgi:hypothetical protein
MSRSRPGGVPWRQTQRNDRLLERPYLRVRVGAARGAMVHAVLPFVGIERTFASEDLPAYRRLVSQASVEILQMSDTD